MSDDWAREYAEAHNRELQEKRQKEHDAQTRRSYAEQGARAKFQEIRQRIEQDLRTLGEASETFATLGVQESSDQKFVVRHLIPWVELSVELHTAMIKYDCRFSPGGESAKDESKTLRISSDLSGVLTVYENGGGKALADTSEISKFILKPLIDFLKTEALK
jgi:hypothetical protein